MFTEILMLDLTDFVHVLNIPELTKQYFDANYIFLNQVFVQNTNSDEQEYEMCVLGIHKTVDLNTIGGSALNLTNSKDIFAISGTLIKQYKFKLNDIRKVLINKKIIPPDITLKEIFVNYIDPATTQTQMYKNVHIILHEEKKPNYKTQFLKYVNEGMKLERNDMSSFAKRCEKYLLNASKEININNYWYSDID